METILLKLGGGLITFKEKSFAADDGVIARLASEIKEAMTQRPLRLVIGHGGGSFPHIPAHRYQVHMGQIREDSLRGFALTQDAAARLNRVLMSALLREAIDAVSFPPSSWALAQRGAIVESFLDPIRLALDKGMVPVVYGDAAVDRDQGICVLSTEKILSWLAPKLGATRVIMATRVDMVCRGDPRKEPLAEPIAEITARNLEEIRPLLSGAGVTDVTGGMAHKVDALLTLAATGVRCEIAGGLIPGNIGNALLGLPHRCTMVG